MALIPPPEKEPAPRWRVPQIAALGLVALLHAVILVFILSSQPDLVAVAPLPRETYLFFKPTPPPPRLPVRIESAQTARKTKPLFRYAPSTAITLPAPVEHAIELALFKCKPENLAELTPEERLKCGADVSMSSFRGAAASNPSPDDRWQAVPADREATQLPCAYVGRSIANPSTGALEPFAGFDLACAAQALGSEEH